MNTFASRTSLALLLAGTNLSGQITLELDDLQFRAGAQKTYHTHQSSITVVTDLIMSPGGPREWNFGSGPTDETYRSEMLPAAQSPFVGPFPGAEEVERLTVDSTSAEGWTFFNLTPTGRELHGFHDGIGNPLYPTTRFNTPVRDYPATINYLDQWNSPTSYSTTLDLGAGLIVPVNVGVTISTFVDSYGTMTLPELGTVEVLRLNEVSTFDSVANVSGTLLALGKSYVRSYIWVSKEHGVVGQITSEGGTTVPASNFDIAARFLRLTEAVPPPDPVDGPVLLSVSRGPDPASLKIVWRAIVGKSYLVEVSGDLEDWSTVGDPILAMLTEETFTEDSVLPGATTKYYRVRQLE